MEPLSAKFDFSAPTPEEVAAAEAAAAAARQASSEADPAAAASSASDGAAAASPSSPSSPSLRSPRGAIRAGSTSPSSLRSDIDAFPPDSLPRLSRTPPGQQDNFIEHGKHARPLVVSPRLAYSPYLISTGGGLLGPSILRNARLVDPASVGVGVGGGGTGSGGKGAGRAGGTGPSLSPNRHRGVLSNGKGAPGSGGALDKQGGGGDPCSPPPPPAGAPAGAPAGVHLALLVQQQRGSGGRGGCPHSPPLWAPLSLAAG